MRNIRQVMATEVGKIMNLLRTRENETNPSGIGNADKNSYELGIILIYIRAGKWATARSGILGQGKVRVYTIRLEIQ